jgi:transcriptional regulator with XRE-family HTH domain
VDKKHNIGRIIREHRKSIPLSLEQLSSVSGVSVSHLGRIETGERVPSPGVLQKIAKPLNFDLMELLVGAGYLSPEPSNLYKEQRNKLRAELNTLIKRVASDNNRIKEIVDRLQMST